MAVAALAIQANMAGSAQAAGEPAGQQAQVERSYDLNIPAKPLPQAIADLSAATGLQVLYTSEKPFGVTSRPLSGAYTPSEALGTMLAGTGISWRFTAANAVTLIAPAASSNGGSIELAPVTVMGEKIERSLRDTATSVTVFGAASLMDRPRVVSTRDLLERVPNVVTSNGTNFAPAVRGVDGTGPAQGADAFFAGVRPRLNVQIDGRAASYNEVVFGDVNLWDVEQVEVLRGPQSTLQGRNAIAGAVIVRTKDPTYYYETGVRGILGNEETRQGSFVFSGPIVDDQLAFRVAVDRRSAESFVHYEPFVGVSDPGAIDMLTLRGKLLWEPIGLPGFSHLLTVSYSEFTQPQGEALVQPYGNHLSSSPNMPTFSPRATSGTSETTWKLSEALTFENTLSLTDTLVKRQSLPTEGIASIDGYEVTEEPRLRFASADKRLQGIGGVYLFHASQDERIDFGGDNRYHDETTTFAAYGEATYSVFTDIDVTLGGRLEQENRDRSGGQGPFFDVDLDETYRVFLPKAGLAWHATEEWTFGALVSRGYNGGGAGVSFAAPFVAYTYDPEYVWNYEAYARADLLGGRLSLTGNVFYADYKDMQLPFQLSPLSTVIRNAERAYTYGAEIGATWRATPGLTLFGDVGLLKTEIESFPGSGFEGNELPRSPAFTSDVGFSYRMSNGLEFSADARFSDAYYSNVDNTPRGKTDPYLTVNAQVGYSFDNWRIFGFVKNVFDSQQPTMIFMEGAGPADDTATIQRPRIFGVGVEAWF